VTTSANDPIFQPLTINRLTLKNRVVRSSLGGRVDYYDGSMSNARIAWDRRFARGGVSAIISSNVGIRTDGIAVPGYASIDHDRTIPSWRALIDEIHRDAAATSSSSTSRGGSAICRARNTSASTHPVLPTGPTCCMGCAAGA